MTAPDEGLRAGAGRGANGSSLRTDRPSRGRVWGTVVMRFVGLILVILGALALGYQGFAHAASEETFGASDEAGRESDELSVPPLVSGIAVVSGLLLLASGGRRAED